MSSSASQNTVVTLVTLGLLIGTLADALFHLGGEIPPVPKLSTRNRPTADPQFDLRIQALFRTPPPLALAPATQSPFFTRYFAPPPKKETPKPVKKPTKKYQITYQGFYKTSSDDHKAFLLVDGAFRSIRVGEEIVDGLILMSLNRDEIEIGPPPLTQAQIGFRQAQTLEISQ